MEWEIWREKYRTITDQLGLDSGEDRRAAEILSDLVPEPDLTELENLISGEECIIFGAGPSLEKDLEKLSREWLDKILISADGATSAVLKYRSPEAVVTDLDGAIEDQLEAWRKGSWIVVHGHGDNLNVVRDIVPQLDERIIGTTQTEAFDVLYNFGGFTDGDRAAFMAHELSASKIYLAGMDLGEEVGEYSGTTDVGQKMVKLDICRELLSWLSEDLGADLVNITTGGEDISSVPKKKIDSTG